MAEGTPAADSAGVAVTVCDHRGHDPAQSFANGIGALGAAGHPPLGFRAYAACTRGAYVDDAAGAVEFGAPVVLLVRPRLKPVQQALELLQAEKLPVAVALAESGLTQVHQGFEAPKQLRALADVLARADGVICPTEAIMPLVRALISGAGGGAVERARPAPVTFIRTPLPVGVAGWTLQRPLSERGGVFIGTREFAASARQHRYGLAAAAELARRSGHPLTVVNTDGRPGHEWLQALGFNPTPATPASITSGAAPPTAETGGGDSTAATRVDIRVIEGRLPYAEYLRVIAAHRIVWQLDASAAPGQVGGDCVLAGTPCVGGNGVAERTAFPGLTLPATDVGTLLDKSAHLLSNDDVWELTMRSAGERAESALSYATIAARLRAFFASLPGDAE